jgi:hypothetical protein
MTFVDENLYRIDPPREAYCLWTERRLHFVRDLNLSEKSK